MSKTKKEMMVLNIATGLFLLTMFALVLTFWNNPVIYPIKLFTVLLHELSHGLAAVVSGGSIIEIEISKKVGGHCITCGGYQPLIASAGYLGSMILGGFIMLSASIEKASKSISMGIAIALIILTAIYIRNTFGVVFTLSFAVFLFVSGRFLPEFINSLVLRFLGIVSSLYAVIDIKEDLIDRTVLISDASRMSELFFFPPKFWGILWIIIAFISTFYFFKWSLTIEMEKKQKKQAQNQGEVLPPSNF